jgi:hypothetical protein
MSLNDELEEASSSSITERLKALEGAGIKDTFIKKKIPPYLESSSLKPINSSIHNGSIGGNVLTKIYQNPSTESTSIPNIQQNQHQIYNYEQHNPAPNVILKSAAQNAVDKDLAFEHNHYHKLHLEHDQHHHQHQEHIDDHKENDDTKSETNSALKHLVADVKPLEDSSNIKAFASVSFTNEIINSLKNLKKTHNTHNELYTPPLNYNHVSFVPDQNESIEKSSEVYSKTETEEESNSMHIPISIFLPKPNQPSHSNFQQSPNPEANKPMSKSLSSSTSSLSSSINFNNDIQFKKTFDDAQNHHLISHFNSSDKKNSISSYSPSVSPHNFILHQRTDSTNKLDNIIYKPAPTYNPTQVDVLNNYYPASRHLITAFHTVPHDHLSHEDKNLNNTNSSRNSNNTSSHSQLVSNLVETKNNYSCEILFSARGSGGLFLKIV